MPDYLSVCEEAARVGGAVLLDWVGRFEVRTKGPSDLVTQADLASQEAIERVLLGSFPDHGFVGEEGGASSRGASDAFHWIVDPLDGTVNYAHGIPHFCVSVALEQRGELLAGVVFDPVLDECFTAGRGAGAYLNGQRINVSDYQELAEVLVATGFPPRVDPGLPALVQFPAVTQNCLGIRRSGSAALNLAYLACGRFGGCWAAELHPWDAAAGALIIQEAGGLITNLDGGPFDVWRPQLLAANNRHVHAQLHNVLTEALA